MGRPLERRRPFVRLRRRSASTKCFILLSPAVCQSLNNITGSKVHDFIRLDNNRRFESQGRIEDTQDQTTTSASGIIFGRSQQNRVPCRGSLGQAHPDCHGRQRSKVRFRPQIRNIHILSEFRQSYQRRSANRDLSTGVSFPSWQDDCGSKWWTMED